MLELHLYMLPYFQVTYVCNIFIYVTQKTYVCYCSPSHMLFKTSHTMHMFFFWSAVRLDPCHHLDTVSKFAVSQWDHTSFKVGYHDYV